MPEILLRDLFSAGRPLDDPSYEPDRLYRLFGKPGLGSWTVMVIALIAVASLVVVGLSELIA